jgi:hypothetical protein
MDGIFFFLCGIFSLRTALMWRYLGVKLSGERMDGTDTDTYMRNGLGDLWDLAGSGSIGATWVLVLGLDISDEGLLGSLCS